MGPSDSARCFCLLAGNKICFFQAELVAGLFFSSFLRRKIRTRRIGANPEKSDLVNFRDADWRKFSELCVLLFLLGKLTKCSQNPGLVSQFSATARGQLNRTGPIANGSEKSAQKNPPRKSPAKSSRFYTTKSLSRFCRGAGPKYSQQFVTYGSLAKGFFCGKFAEILWRLHGNLQNIRLTVVSIIITPEKLFFPNELGAGSFITRVVFYPK